jgi:hypothetical protein
VHIYTYVSYGYATLSDYLFATTVYSILVVYYSILYNNLYLPPARTRAHIYVCIIWRYAVLRMRSLRSISTSPCIPGIPKNTASRSDRSPKGSGPTCYNDIGIRPVTAYPEIPKYLLRSFTVLTSAET